ncbi:Guanine-nucleotide dissociation stimulator CDC25 [Penicillium sp. DV-2018c]|nr:Guanine-nucleotide dissociation stimulator CDC25 [Penicillium sp. DV-2018c]
MQSTSPEESVFEPSPTTLLSPGGRQHSAKKAKMASQSDSAIATFGYSYQQIFQSDLEIPAFYMTYRWWEDEATTVFWAFEIQEITRVVQFGLFRDENLPRTSLRSRNADTIDAFLVSLSEPHEYELLANLSHMQRVEEIIRRSSIPPFQAIPWSWLPPQSSPTLDAEKIATEIEAESHFHFRQIAFEEIVRAALGYYAISVEWFLQQHTALYILLVDHLYANPEDIPLYTEVEKHLRSRSPFAHRALIQCLRSVSPVSIRDLPQSNTAGFEFIAGPIQDLFKEQPGRLEVMLKILSVLAIRFRRWYIHAPAMDWQTPFDTSIPLLEDYLISSSESSLARNLSIQDEQRFAEMTRRNFVAGDAVVEKLLADWRALGISVWECCAALPEMISDLQVCAQSLFAARNYHSLTAIINGFHTYTISTMRASNTGTTPGHPTTKRALIPQEIAFLMNPAQNYAAYRQHYLKFPGLPFMAPHLRDRKQNGDSVLQPVFQYLQSTQ